MATQGAFGDWSRRGRRLQPMQTDTMQYAPKLMEAPPLEFADPIIPRRTNATNPSPSPVASPSQASPVEVPPRGAFGSSYTPGKRDWWKEISSDPLGFFLTGTDGLSQQRDEAMAYQAQQAAKAEAQTAQMARIEQAGVLGLQGRDADFYVNAQDEYYKVFSDGTKPIAVADGTDLYDPKTGSAIYSNEKNASSASDIRQVGNQIVERQADGSWKPVYQGSSPAETAQAFLGFIDLATGEQMVAMSDGTVRGTGRNAYVPPQISSVGGVPVAVDKRTFATTELSPLENVAGNKAAMASAEVQGKAQGEAAFNLPTIEMRSQAAMNSIRDLKGRDIGTRFGMQGKLYAIPGTDGANVQAVVNQVTSQAFLNAFDQLRGAGAITEREGQAATQAVTRLQNQNITIGEALKAMDELDSYYRKGIEVARQKAVKAPVLPGRPALAAGATRTREGVPYLLAKPTPTGSTLTPEEQAELEALRSEFGQ